MGVREAAVAGVLVAVLAACGSHDPRPGDAAAAPDVLDVTCTPGTGIDVGSATVRAQADGVHLRVVDHSGIESTTLFAGRDVDHLLGNERVAGLGDWLLTVAPGELPLSCAAGDAGPTEDPVVVQVIDPGKHWTRPDTPRDAGCTEDGAFYPRPPAVEPSEFEALDRMVAENYPKGLRTYEVRRLDGGYDGVRSTRFVLLRNGSPAATGYVSRTADDSWSAGIDGSCAERMEAPVERPPGPDAAADGPPTTLHVTCTPDEAVVDAPEVRTSPDGVRLVVDDRSGWDGAYFVYGLTADEVSGDRTDYPDLSPLRVGPGRWYVGCSASGAEDGAVLTTVRVVDPDGNWRRPRQSEDCRYSGSIYGPGGEGSTEQAAIADLLRVQGGDRVRLYDEGYWRRPGHGYVVQSPMHRTGGQLVGWTYVRPDGSWYATADGTCDAAIAARLLSRGWVDDRWDRSPG